MPALVSEKLLLPKGFCHASFTKKLPSLISFGISTGCFIHNLYAQYQHNKSLEAQLKVEIDGEVKTINASPNYFNAYTIYNILYTVGQLAATISIGVSLNKLFNVYFMPLIPGFVSKLVSLKDDYKEYNFTDENGNSVSPEIVASCNILDVEYLNN